MSSSMELLSNPIVTVLSIPLFLLLISIYIYNLLKHEKETKKYHPRAGTVFDMLKNYNQLHHYMTDLAAKYKTYRMFSPLHGEIYTTDPVNVEYVLKTNFHNYGKQWRSQCITRGTYISTLLRELLGEGIFTVDGTSWQQQRKVASHEFSTKILRDFSSATFRENAIKLGNIFSEAAKSNKIIDINDWFMRATTDSIFKVGFGVDLNNLSGASEENVRFMRAFDDANSSTYERFVDVTWKIKKFFNIGLEAELKKNIKVIDEFVYKVIQAKIEHMHKSKDDEFSLKKEDILSRFIQINDKDQKYLRDIILNFALAGKDPIAVTMSWLIYMLCKHPEIQDKVAKEIKEAIDIKEKITSVADFAANVNEATLDKMQYLQAVLSETIRLYPALPVDPKICFADDVLPDGCSVKKGDMVAFLPYAMGRMKFIWGDDAHEFKPSRWLDHNGCFYPESPFKFTAFQGGPRTCLGRDFAYRQLKIFSSIFLGCFEFRLKDEKDEYTYRMSINMHVDRPLQVRVFSKYGFTNP